MAKLSNRFQMKPQNLNTNDDDEALVQGAMEINGTDIQCAQSNNFSSKLNVCNLN